MQGAMQRVSRIRYTPNPNTNPNPNPNPNPLFSFPLPVRLQQAFSGPISAQRAGGRSKYRLHQHKGRQHRCGYICVRMFACYGHEG